MKSRVLFVTKGDTGHFKDGFPYAMELAKIVDGGLFILFNYDKQIVKTFEDEMAAAAFAQAGETETARDILSEREKALTGEAEQKVRLLQVLSQGADLIVEHRVTTD
ncbi:MAG TPA: hypothetical protein ENG86_04385, partial [Nitrospirae bacterium]|nr:hypothetical protein [Nitrospirota bacterium]